MKCLCCSEKERKKVFYKKMTKEHDQQINSIFSPNYHVPEAKE